MIHERTSQLCQYNILIFYETPLQTDDIIVFNVLTDDNKRNRVQSKEFNGDMRRAEEFYLLKVSELVGWL